MAGTPTMVHSHPLRSATFDRFFIAAIPAIAIASALLVMIEPSALWTVILLDIWLLGYQHVIATWTRIGFDRESLARYWPLIVVLPPVVFVVVYTIGVSGGAVVLNTIYFHWLWFHYVRQSEGVSRAYAGRCGSRELVDAPLLRGTFYFVPTVALLTLSTLGEENLLGVPLYLMSVPVSVLWALWAFAVVLLLAVAQKLARLRRNGRLSNHYVGYIVSHYTIFVVAYGTIRNTTIAWLCLNIWHNIQYLSFVWLSHQTRFKGKIAGKGSTILSTLALPRNAWMYVTACLVITVTFYMMVENAVGFAYSNGISATLATVVAYQTINFHHYIVDAIIWRRPKNKAVPAPMAQ